VTTTANTALRTARRLEILTVGWNGFEAGVAVISGLAAHSIALTGFGLDSGIEVVSAFIVLGRLRADLDDRTDERRERRALRAVGATFFLLAAYLTVDGLDKLVTGSRPDTSPTGVAISVAALIVMPVLALAKGRVARRLDSRLRAVVLADAAESRLCALLALTTLAGLLAYMLAGWWWADPVAGFVVVILALHEGAEAWAGNLDED
jgi:divalent metal cation (Fe/Co/Zn/Cd) transporter